MTFCHSLLLEKRNKFLKNCQKLHYNDIMNDINVKSPMPLHEQAERTALLKSQDKTDFPINVPRGQEIMSISFNQ